MNCPNDTPNVLRALIETATKARNELAPFTPTRLLLSAALMDATSLLEEIEKVKSES